tara:strand:- start:3258 stop:3854 length:597 start_codon:yes stop_codon:yes gene_type:complete
MALESGTYINSLNASNPAATDSLSQADDHLRLIKSTVLATFPNVSGAVTATHTELNLIDGVTSTTAELNILDGVTSTAAELNLLDGVTATTAELNYSDTGASVGVVVASKVVTVDANKDVASFRNVTATGELEGGSLDINGDGDISGTLNVGVVDLGAWTIDEVSGELRFLHNGTAKFKLTSAGVVTAVGDITASGSI